MNGKIVKIVDENNIEREAKVITTVKDNGFEYVVYVIDRDNDNSNIFVSRLVTTADGVKFDNIEDVNEKSRVDELVKDIIKKAVE